MAGGFFKLRLRLLVGAALCAPPVPVAAAEEQQDLPPSGTRGEIVVLGQRVPEIFAGVFADAELDENDIAAYGFDTIGELLEQIGTELDPLGEGPVILINGQLATGINDISDLPTEAASRIQVLPRTIAARLGQSASRRVINVVVKPDLQQVTVNTRGTLSTRGDAFQGEGELNLLRLANNNRRSLVFRAQHFDPLTESDRNIRPDTQGTPFGTIPNVVGRFGSEIDPRLSLLAGFPVTAAGAPAGVVRPTLADFAARADVVNAGDSSEFRTLVDELDIYSVNGNITERFGDRTTLLMNARLERSEGNGLNGLASALLSLPATSPFSPFSRDVSLAFLLPQPLRNRFRTTSLDLGETLNTRVGRFDVSARVNFVHRVSNVLTDREFDFASLQASVTGGALNPFAGIAREQFGGLRQDRSRSRSNYALAQIIANGPIFNLPAGAVLLTTTLSGRFDRFSSRTRGQTNLSNFFKRDEAAAQGNLQIPLIGGNSFGAGQLTADLNGQVREVSGAGTLHDYGGALTWQPDRALSLRAAFTQEEVPPSTSSINEAVVVIENFRAFDFIRGETVLVRYLTGGNPNLPTPKRRMTTLEANARPFRTYDLTLNAAYMKLDNRDVFSSLPPVSAEVQAAFPDRFVRDGAGVLVLIDARPVTFIREDSEQIRWGINFRRTFGGTAIGEEDEARSMPRAGRGVRVNLSATHSWTLNSTRQARAALPEIDLLRGGAIGYGGGVIRHFVNFSAGAATRGVGLQLNGQYRGKSILTTGTAAAPGRLTFQDRTTINARMFANLGPLLPESDWAKGLRLSLQATNLLDSKQRVRDGAGSTPLRYQPFLLDPVGRSLTLGVRKAF